MHIPLITKLASSILPFLSNPIHTSSSPATSPLTLTFRPIHAHRHVYTNTSSRPSLLLRNATTSFPLHDISNEAYAPSDESYLLDNPSEEIASRPLAIRTTPIIVRRPRIRPPSILSWALSARKQRYFTGNTSELWVAPDYADIEGDWEDVEIIGPDTRDRQTLIALAKMSSNAYVTTDGGEWWPVEGWNSTLPFGWEAESDGLRGHVVSLP